MLAFRWHLCWPGLAWKDRGEGEAGQLKVVESREEKKRLSEVLGEKGLQRYPPEKQKAANLRKSCQSVHLGKYRALETSVSLWL